MDFTRRKVTDDFEITLTLKNDGFITPPRLSQKEWLIELRLAELASELQYLNKISKGLVGVSERPTIKNQWSSSTADYSDGSQLIVEGQQVMQDWEHPYMRAMAKVVSQSHGDVLEIGFGMGISATYMLDFGVDSYTVIECNQQVKEHFSRWQNNFPRTPTKLVFGKWQEVIDSVGEYDGIFFDTYPTSEEEFQNHIYNDVTYGAHFFEAAAKHLKKGGVFTYFSGEIDTLSRRHKRRLLEHFESVTCSVVRDLHPPSDCNYWWADSMVLVHATK
jgi:guanidinoacetate N-methyltransferase